MMHDHFHSEEIVDDYYETFLNFNKLIDVDHIACLQVE